VEDIQYNPEARRMAFDAYLAQFESIRDETNLATGLQNNMVSFSIALISGTIALMTIKNDQDISLFIEFPQLFLVVSILMGLMTWASLESEIRIHDYRYYIHQVLSTKVQMLLGKEISERFSPLKMELAEIYKFNKLRSILRGLLVSAKFMISFVPSISLLVSVVYSSSRSLFENWVNAILITLNLLIIIVVPVVLISHAIFVTKYYRN
jgi:hypothetical protein